MDEAPDGQKGRTGFRWWVRGERPRGLRDRRFTRAYLFSAVCQATGAMQTLLDHLAVTLADDARAVLVLHRTGWHGSRTRVVLPNVTLARCRLKHRS